jgi:serine/threonine-protein kinase
VQVPGVNGAPAEQALDALRAAHLVPRTIRVFDGSVPSGRVIAVSPPPGVTVTWGATVRVYVSKGQELVTVPDVRSKPKAEAEALLRAAGLRWRYSLGLGGTVVGQDPKPGEKAPRDTVVRLAVNLL